MENRVSLIIEGSYPYVAGGVASWVQQLITNLPHIEFELILLLSKDENLVQRYEYPPNVKRVDRIFLMSGTKKPLFMPSKFDLLPEAKRFLDNYFSYEDFENMILAFNNYKDKDKIKKQALYSSEVYDLIEKQFENGGFVDKSFLDFFWYMRSIYMGFLNILLFTPNKTKVYHAVSTGYAGIAASLCKILSPKSRVMLTEHGIYTRERLMEVAISEWPDIESDVYDSSGGISIYQNIWVEFFSMMSKVCYNYSDLIISLHHKNNDIQISEGADRQKVIALHNGINLKKFEFVQRDRVSKIPVIGFLGRIVKIKDVKTLIKTAAIVCAKNKDAIFKLAGPYEEDKEYYEECVQLVTSLGLEGKVTFLGKVDSASFFKEIDIMILTSLSEGQPLVISEAASCGVPTVATNVGGSLEMIDGLGLDGIGPSGIITSSVSPNESADAILKMIEDEEFYKNCSINGRLRAEQFYNEEDFIASYDEIYKRFLNWQA